MKSLVLFLIGVAFLIGSAQVKTSPVKDGGRTAEAFAVAMLGAAFVAWSLFSKMADARTARLAAALVLGAAGRLLLVQPHWLQWLKVRPFELKTPSVACGVVFIVIQGTVLFHALRKTAGFEPRLRLPWRWIAIGGLILATSGIHYSRLDPVRFEAKAWIVAAYELCVAGALNLLFAIHAFALVRDLPKSFVDGWKERFDRLAVHDRRTACFLAVFATTVAAGLAYFVLDRMPHIPDGVAYLFQARTMAEGRLSNPLPATVDALRIYLLDARDGRWFAVTNPGWPAVLAIGAAFGIEWTINPILSGVAVLLTHGVARRFLDKKAALGATALTAASPWFLWLGASDMTHMMSLVLMLASWRALIAAHDRPTGAMRHVLRFLAGLFCGCLCLVRPLDGLLAGAAAGLVALIARPRAFLSLAFFAIGCVGGAALYLPFNAALTGDIARVPINDYLDRLWYPGANRMGFGADVGNPPGRWALLDPRPGHGPIDVVLNTNQNLYNVDFESFGWPIGALLIVGLFGAVGRKDLRDRCVLVFMTVMAAAYNLYWFSGGPDFGARYWFLMFPAIVWLTVRGSAMLGDRFDGASTKGDGRTRVALAAALLSLIAVFVFLPWRATTKYKDYRGFHADYRAMKEKGTLDNCVVFVATDSEGDWSSAFILNELEPGKSSAPIFLRSTNPESDAAAAGRYPQRQIVWIDGRDRKSGTARIDRRK